MVGCCGPNGSGDTAVWSWVGCKKCTLRPVFWKNQTKKSFFSKPLLESHPEISYYMFHMLYGHFFASSVKKCPKRPKKRPKKQPKIGHWGIYRLICPKPSQQLAPNWLSIYYYGTPLGTYSSNLLASFIELQYGSEFSPQKNHQKLAIG